VAVIRSVVRSIKAVAYFGIYGIELAVTQPKTRRQRAEWLHRFCSAMMKAFDVTATVEGELPGSGVIICNHTGYLDIVTIASLKPVVYCAKAEMEHWFFLGWMTRMCGTVFVDRGAGGSADKATAGMQAAAAEGVPVAFFPEGTTSNGQQVLEFRTGLLAKSLEAQQPITAAYISYTLDKDNGPGVTVEDNVCFWGDDVGMFQHIFKFCGLQGTHVWVRIAPEPIQFSEAILDRRVAADEAREAVLELMPAGTGEMLVKTEEDDLMLHQK